MNRPHDDTALQAANVALTGRGRRTASSFASVELREQDPKVGRWEVFVGIGVAVVTVVVVLVAWLY